MLRLTALLLMSTIADDAAATSILRGDQPETEIHVSSASACGINDFVVDCIGDEAPFKHAKNVGDLAHTDGVTCLRERNSTEWACHVRAATGEVEQLALQRAVRDVVLAPTAGWGCGRDVGDVACWDFEYEESFIISLPNMERDSRITMLMSDAAVCVRVEASPEFHCVERESHRAWTGTASMTPWTVWAAQSDGSVCLFAGSSATGCWRDGQPVPSTGSSPPFECQVQADGMTVQALVPVKWSHRIPDGAVAFGCSEARMCWLHPERGAECALSPAP